MTFDDITRKIADQMVHDLRCQTGDFSIHVRWQPKGKRFSLDCDKGVFSNIHPFQPRKNRFRVEVPRHLVEKAQMSIKDFDQNWPKGWYEKDSSDLIDIPQDGGKWDASRYKFAIDILVHVWRAR